MITFQRKRHSAKSIPIVSTLLCLASVMTLLFLVYCNVTVLFSVTNRHANLDEMKQYQEKRVSSRIRNGEGQGWSVVTVVLPSVVNPSKQMDRLVAISETWGSEANAVFVVHEDARKSSSSSALDGFPPLERDSVLPKHTNHKRFPMVMTLPPSISERDGVSRLQFVLTEVTSTLDPDYLFFVNDHTFVWPPNLWWFLSRQQMSSSPRTSDLYAGHALQPRGKQFAFNSGAAGYVLSARSAERLVEAWDRQPQGQGNSDNNNNNENNNNNDNPCTVGTDSRWLQGNPGLVSAQCLHAFGVDPIDTRTVEPGNYGHTHKAHMFHAYGIVRTVMGDYDEWYVNKHADVTIPALGSDYHILESGSDGGCSSRTVSFHYVERAETRALYHILVTIQQQQQSQPKSRSSSKGGEGDNDNDNDNDMSEDDKQIQTLVLSLWPDNQSKGVVGGYSKPLPRTSDQTFWKHFIKVLRKIASASKPD